MAFPDELVFDLRALAETSAISCEIPKETTIEWIAADAIVAATNALREIASGQPDPAVIAAAALVILAASAAED